MSNDSQGQLPTSGIGASSAPLRSQNLTRINTDPSQNYGNSSAVGDRFQPLYGNGRERPRPDQSPPAAMIYANNNNNSNNNNNNNGLSMVSDPNTSEMPTRAQQHGSTDSTSIEEAESNVNSTSCVVFCVFAILAIVFVFVGIGLSKGFTPEQRFHSNDPNYPECNSKLFEKHIYPFLQQFNVQNDENQSTVNIISDTYTDDSATSNKIYQLVFDSEIIENIQDKIHNEKLNVFLLYGAIERYEGTKQLFNQVYELSRRKPNINISQSQSKSETTQTNIDIDKTIEIWLIDSDLFDPKNHAFNGTMEERTLCLLHQANDIQLKYDQSENQNHIQIVLVFDHLSHYFSIHSNKKDSGLIWTEIEHLQDWRKSERWNLFVLESNPDMMTIKHHSYAKMLFTNGNSASNDDSKKSIAPHHASLTSTSDSICVPFQDAYFFQLLITKYICQTQDNINTKLDHDKKKNTTNNTIDGKSDTKNASTNTSEKIDDELKQPWFIQCNFSAQDWSHITEQMQYYTLLDINQVYIAIQNHVKTSLKMLREKLKQNGNILNNVVAVEPSISISANDTQEQMKNKHIGNNTSDGHSGSSAPSNKKFSFYKNVTFPIVLDAEFILRILTNHQTHFPDGDIQKIKDYAEFTGDVETCFTNMKQVVLEQQLDTNQSTNNDTTPSANETRTLEKKSQQELEQQEEENEKRKPSEWGTLPYVLFLVVFTVFLLLWSCYLVYF